MHVDQKGKVLPSGGELKKFDRFAVGALRGFQMALDGLLYKGFDGFHFKDFVKIRCIGIRPPDDPTQSPMPEFAISVDRGDEAPASHPMIGGTSQLFDSAPPQRDSGDWTK